MQTTAIVILALLSLIGPGALIVAYIAWRRRRRDEDAQAERAQAERSDQQTQGGGGPRPVEPRR